MNACSNSGWYAPYSFKVSIKNCITPSIISAILNLSIPLMFKINFKRKMCFLGMSNKEELTALTITQSISAMEHFGWEVHLSVLQLHLEY